MIDFLDIKYLIAVAEHGGISKAADKVGITQPAMTRRIKKLEDLFNAKFLIRSSDGVSLTPLGESFVKSGQGLMAHLGDFEERIRLHSKGEGDKLAIGLKPGLFNILFRAVLSDFLESFPYTSVKIEIGATPNLMRLLSIGEIDFAFGATGYADEKDSEIVLKRDLEFQPMFRLPMVCLVRKEHPLVGRDFTEEDLFNFPLVAPKPPLSIINVLKDKYRRYGMSYSIPKLVVDDFMIAAQISAQTDYITFVFEDDAEFIKTQADVVELKRAIRLEPLQIGLVKRSTWEVSESAKKFISLTKEHSSKWSI